MLEPGPMWAHFFNADWADLADLKCIKCRSLNVALICYTVIQTVLTLFGCKRDVC